MKVWVSVYQHCGIVYEILVFKKKEDAKKRFDEFIDACGGLNENAIDDFNYTNGDNGVFYYFDEVEDDITIQEVDVK